MFVVRLAVLPFSDSATENDALGLDEQPTIKKGKSLSRPPIISAECIGQRLEIVTFRQCFARITTSFFLPHWIRDIRIKLTVLLPSPSRSVP
ncbi:MAG TPA: hypothetical protein VNJ52_04725 [Patescibacteria group bacterium]|nr:hypothetical protein [Patescibacteria group bacterium]